MQLIWGFAKKEKLRVYKRFRLVIGGFFGLFLTLFMVIFSYVVYGLILTFAP